VLLNWRMCVHTGHVGKWMNRRPAWQYGLLVGISTWLITVLAVTLIDRLTAPHTGPRQAQILMISFIAAWTTLGQTWMRQSQSSRCGSRQRFSEPGPMLPYAGLTSASDPDGPPGARTEHVTDSGSP
jgi:hypothetical protein